MTGRISVFCVLAALLCVAAALPAKAQEEKTFPVVTGENWMSATHAERLSFITGLTTMIELEKEVQGPTPPADERTLIPKWVSGLSGFTLEEIVTALDRVYQQHPEFKERPVIDVLWHEVAFPGAGH